MIINNSDEEPITSKLELVEFDPNTNATRVVSSIDYNSDSDSLNRVDAVVFV